MTLHSLRCALVVLGTALAVLWTVGPARAIDYPPLFNTNEVRSDNLKPFPIWTDSLGRFLDERALGEGECLGTEFNRCYYREWDAFLDTLSGYDAAGQLDAVNRYMNQAPYITDLVNWGIKDYWETPRQFFMVYGDCEDYAIAKFMSLRVLGYSNDQLRVVVLQDLNLQIPHAVLAVYTSDQALILDNQLGQVVPAHEIYHYHPFYSVNEEAWWLHKSY